MSELTSSTTVHGGFNFSATHWTTVLAAGEYEAAGAELNLAPGAVRVAVHRLRQRYRELARLEIAGTVNSLSDVEDELTLLLEAIRR